MANVEEKIIDGLTNFAEQTQDVDLAREGAGLYKSVSDVFEATVNSDESCSLAFPAMIIRPDIRTLALVAILPQRVIIAWRKGAVKKRTEHVVIPRASITKVSSYVSNRASLQGAKLVDIDAGETTTIALPKNDNKVRDLIKQAVSPARSSAASGDAQPVATPERPTASPPPPAKFLSRGGNVSLTSGAPGLSKILVGLGWDAHPADGSLFDLDASAFILGSDGKVSSDQHFIFYNNLKSPDGSVEHKGDSLTGEGGGDDEAIIVNLEGVPADIDKVAIAVTIDQADARGQNFGAVSNAYIRIVNQATGSEIARYDLGQDASTETAVVFGEVYRNGSDWSSEPLARASAVASARSLRARGEHLMRYLTHQARPQPAVVRVVSLLVATLVSLAACSGSNGNSDTSRQPTSSPTITAASSTQAPHSRSAAQPQGASVEGDPAGLSVDAMQRLIKSRLPAGSVHDPYNSNATAIGYLWRSVSGVITLYINSEGVLNGFDCEDDSATSNPMSNAFVEFCINVPYSGSDTSAARAWVSSQMSNLGTDASVETTIGGVPWQIEFESAGPAVIIDVG